MLQRAVCQPIRILCPSKLPPLVSLRNLQTTVSFDMQSGCVAQLSPLNLSLV